MSRAVNGPLDELDPIDGSYCLEVSSPGINRELTRPEHFEAFLDCFVIAKLIRPLPDGTREVGGILRARNDDGSVTCKQEKMKPKPPPLPLGTWCPCG